MLNKVKPFLVTAAVVVGVLAALKYLAPESLRSKIL